MFLVKRARERGVSSTAKFYGCSRNTIRKWLGRFDGTIDSLTERSRAPNRRPNKLSAEAEREILAANKKLPTWGAKRLKHDMRLPYSDKAIRRVLKENGLQRKWRRKKHETKHCLREIKRNWPAWHQICVDTKHLNDLPEYWVQAQLHRLPRYQYTARDSSTGALFLGWTDELSLTYSELFINRILIHLKRNGADLKQVTVQTDNGSEFIGSTLSSRDSAFTDAITRLGATHRTIRPRAHRYQADVETVHSLMEREFYIERFRSRREFIEKAITYQHYFNYIRPNSGKEYKCPYELLIDKNLTRPLQTLYLPPAYLEDLLRERLNRHYGAHDVRTHPSLAGTLLMTQSV